MARTLSTAPRPGGAEPGTPPTRSAGQSGGAAHPAEGSTAPRSISDALERSKPVTNRDLLRLRRSLKMDSLARLLGFLGLLFGVCALVGVLILAVTLRRRVQRLERDMDRSRAADA